MSQAIPLITDLLAVLEDISQLTRDTLKYDGDFVMEDANMDELAHEAQMTRQVLIDTVEKKGVGHVSVPA